MPLVTVILPTFNRPLMLKESISSVLNQTYKNFEIIVINDGGSPVNDIIASLSDERIRLLEFKENKGQAKVRNIALKEAKGEYIAYLDDDDIYYSEHLETLVNALINSADMVAYTGAYYANQEWITDRYVTINKEEINHPFDAQKLLLHNYIPLPNLMHKKNIIDLSGVFDEILSNSVHEDWDLLIRFSQFTNFIRINKITTEIRFGKNKISTTNKNRRFFLDTMLIIHERYRDLVKDPEIFLQQKIIEWGLIKELFYDRNIDIEPKYIIGTCNFIFNKFEESNNQLSNFLNNKNNIIDDQNNIINDKENIINDKNHLINQIQNILNDKEQYISELISSVHEKDLIIEQNNQIINQLKNLVNDNKIEIKNLKEIILEKDNVLKQIYSSHAWWLLRKYYRLIDVLFPQNSKIRRVTKQILSVISIHRIKQSLSYIKQYGIIEFLRKIRSKFTDYSYNIQKDAAIEEPTVIPDIKIIEPKDDEDIPTEDVKISVIIPTKNAGDHFKRLIKSINFQKGFKEVETIIVDSGSTDETLDIVKDYNLKLIEIKPEEFSHSYARNLGAAQASGDFIFFTVQDSLLPDKYFLHSLYKKLNQYNTAAVSCHEFIREDSDLYYNFISYYHGKYMGLDKNDIIMSMPEKDDFEALRSNANLNNIACLINKNIFDKYKFEAKYAEDLHLGLRLIKDGYKLALIGSVKIIHSHNRSPFYFLKRGYVDTLYLTEIIPSFKLIEVEWDKLKKDIISTHEILIYLIKNVLDKLTNEYSIENFIELINHEFHKILNKNEFQNTNTIDSFVNKIYNETFLNKKHSSNMLLNSVIHSNNQLFDFIKGFNKTIDSDLIDQYKKALQKIFAFYTGIYIAHCELTTEALKDIAFLEAIKDLKRGI